MSMPFSVKLSVIAFFSSAFTLVAAAQQQLPALFNKDHHTVVIAHRGDHVRVPGNTIAAYQQAITYGADYVEVDLRTTKDGHLVVMHDATVNRMTNGKGAVENLTFKEIKKLVIHGIREGDTKIYHVPDFKSVLKTCKSHINIYLDFKNANVKKTYRLIKRFGMEHHIAVYLNKEKQYGAWKKVAPKMPLIASLPKNMNLQQMDSLLNKKKINIVDNAYDPEKIKSLHHKDIVAWLDAESADEDSTIWRKILTMGADGLQTDHPEKLIRYLKKEGMR